MAIPLDKAMDLLDLSSIEKEEMKKHFQWVCQEKCVSNLKLTKK